MLNCILANYSLFHWDFTSPIFDLYRSLKLSYCRNHIIIIIIIIYLLE